jgi:cytochrome c peroxidase
VHELGRALEAFMLSPPFSPFSSKYDDFVRGRVDLSPLETEGLALFKEPEKGNCASCHRLNDRVPLPDRSLFTDYGFETVAAPRRHGLRAGANDRGLCARTQPEHASETRFCGSFRTPSLRNVALRPSYMHNGAFSTLRDVVAFYATRGTDPKRWYPSGDFDDLAPEYRQFVNVDRPPYDRRVGETPRLDEHEIDAVVAFLETLSDRDIPPAPSP